MDINIHDNQILDEIGAIEVDDRLYFSEPALRLQCEVHDRAFRRSWLFGPVSVFAVSMWLSFTILAFYVVSGMLK